MVINAEEGPVKDKATAGLHAVAQYHRKANKWDTIQQRRICRSTVPDIRDNFWSYAPIILAG